MVKEQIYLTDITLHARDFRQTVNFAKVAQKGRMYSPMSQEQAKSIGTSDTGAFQFPFSFPPDLQERIGRGEVEIMVPKGGLYIYAGRDVYEFVESIKQKERRQLIHHSRAWHAGDKKLQ